MNRRERLAEAVQGRQPDRIPVSFWYHFPLDFPSGKPLADAELAFFRQYEPDFLKVMHDLVLDLPDDMERITSADDWRKLEPMDGRSGNFAHQLEALRLIKAELPPDVPVIDTIFDPFAAANKLCGKLIMDHVKNDLDAVKQGLSAITESLISYTEAWMEAGGDGIFYALDGAQLTTMSEEMYREVFMPLDRRILEAGMKKGSFNVLHVHGTGIMFDMVHDLPAHVLNWSSRITYPDLAEARRKHKGCIAGGINELEIGWRSPSELMEEARKAVAQAGCAGFILTPGCAIPTDTPEANIKALSRVVEV